MHSSSTAAPLCQKDAAATIQTLVDHQQCSTSCPDRQGAGIVLYAHPLHHHLARILAKARRQGHDHCRKPHEDRGAKGNNRAEAYGVLSELMIVQALEYSGLQPEGYCLLDERPHTGADFLLCGVSFDVKTVPFRSGFLCVNEEQRLDPAHAVDFILPAWFTRPTELHVMVPIPYNDVACWTLRQGHSPYRSISVDVLQPLHSFAELEGGKP